MREGYKAADVGGAQDPTEPTSATVVRYQHHVVLAWPIPSIHGERQSDRRA